MINTEKFLRVEKTMPLFVFARRPDIETASGFILAGRLFLDKDKAELVPNIVELLLKEAARSGAETNTRTIGWEGDGGRPHNAVDIDDDAVMAAWAKGCNIIEVRVDPRKNDGSIRLDSEIMRQLRTPSEKR